MELVRLSKLMSELGLCSRREADDLIARGLVWVDGRQVTELGTKVLRTAKVQLAREAKDEMNDKVTIILNKPIGYVSGQPEPGMTPAIRLITAPRQDKHDKKHLHAKHFKELAVAGRLDVDSQGLLVFTQNGQVAKSLIGQDTEIEKEYLVRVEGSLSDRGLKLLNFGLSLDDTPLKPAQVEWLNEDQLRFILQEGKKRQIRRMCELVGLNVIGLKRVRIGKIRLGDLKEGEWRFLRPNEKF